MTHEHVLDGCSPAPLASYLKSLAVLRLVSEGDPQEGGDPDARGFWRNDVFILHTRLSREGLCSFFLNGYQPTPLIAPWNGGSGFYFQESKEQTIDLVTGKKLKTGVRDQETQATRTVAKIAASSARRLASYRQTIRLARLLVANHNLTEAPDSVASPIPKDQFIQAFRNVAPDASLSALDSTVVITADRSRFPPILGTGGNDGNLEFTNNFMQRLIGLMDLRDGLPTLDAPALLNAALFNLPCPALVRGAIGQFLPGSAGGPNSITGFEGDPISNPWDFVLMLEGATLFAASAVRRLESSAPAAMASPFTFTARSRLSTEGGTSADDDDDSRSEMWMPLWPEPASAEEVRVLLSEGRATLNGRTAGDGLDFARSAVRLGVNRGIAGFQRYGFLKRQGKNFLATPLSRILVHRNPGADLIGDLEQWSWLQVLQRYASGKHCPTSIREAVRDLDRALFAITRETGHAALQNALRKIGRIEQLVSRSPKARESVGAVPRLSLGWGLESDDGSVEFSLARALAGLHVRMEIGRPSLHMRRHLVDVSEPVNAGGMRKWEAATSRLAVWGPGPLTKKLSQMVHRRRLATHALGVDGALLDSHTGATREQISSFLFERTADQRIDELLAGLACVDWQDSPTSQPKALSTTAILPAAYILLKVLFTPESTLRRLQFLPSDRTLRLPAEIPALLTGNQINAAVAVAWRRLHALGLRMPGLRPPQSIGLDGSRLLAALCVPITSVESRRMLHDLGVLSAHEAAVP